LHYLRCVVLIVVGLLLSVLMEGNVSGAESGRPEDASTVVCGTLDENTLWIPANSPYLVTCSSAVAPGVVLSIEPGVTVKFQAGTELAVDGSLQALGTDALPIMFTSANSVPARGDWAWLRFTVQHSSSLLRYAIVEYAGLYGSSLYLERGTLTVQNSTIRQGKQVGLLALVVPTLLDSTFENNGGPAAELHFSAGSAQPGAIGGNSGSGNGVNGILIAGTIDSEVTLGGNSGLAYYSSEEAFGVTAGHTLTLSAGATFKLDGTKFIVAGSIRAEGREDAPVVFTSLQDDAYGGDTNQDGTNSVPLPGDWRGILYDPSGGGWNPPYVVYLPVVQRQVGWGGEVRTTVQESSLYLDRVLVRYGGLSGGGSHEGDLDVFGGRAQILNSTIEHSAWRGIYIEDTSPEIRNSVIADNADMGLWLLGSAEALAPVLVDNVFRDNGTFAAYLIFGQGCHPSTEMHGNIGWGNGMVNGIYVEGYVNTPTGCRWGANIDFPYVVWTISVSHSGRMELDPGVEMKFVDPDLTRASGTLIVSGTLEALGTPEAPIAFTSFWDDEIGGDTDGTTDPAAPGDWLGFIVREGGNATFDHAIFRYGGANGTNLSISDARVVLANSNLSYSADHGLGVVTGDWASSLTATGNTFDGNLGYAARIRSESPGPIRFELEGNQGSGNGVNGILVDADVSDMSFKANPGLPYVIQHVTVAAGATATVYPGTVFKGHEGESGGGSLFAVDGNLVASGTEALSVYWTSFYDDTVGGDTDGEPSAGTAGDWIGIAVRPGARATLAHTVVRYGGAGGAALSVDGASLEMESSEVSYGGGQGLLVLIASPATVLAVRDSSFIDNGEESVSVRSASPTPVGFEFSGNGGSENGLNGIRIDATVGGMAFRANPTLPYVVQSIKVASGTHVSVEPGTVFKADEAYAYGGSLIAVEGELEVEGTEGNPVYLTSLYDGSVGGGTVAEDSATQPSPGDWLGISVGGSGALTLAQAVIRYATTAVFSNGAVTANDSTVTLNQNHGFASMPGASLDVENSVISSNGQHGVSNGGQAHIAHCDIMNNAAYGVYSWASGVVIDAEYNYWGAADGPSWDGNYCSSPPQGSGDLVTCHSVDYEPFSFVPYH